MSFECNNGVCYIKRGGPVGTGEGCKLIMPRVEDVWTIYGKGDCPYCTRLREFFDGIGIRYVYHDIERCDGNLSELNSLTGGNFKTVPMVFFYKLFIGGYDDVMKYLGITDR